MQAESCISASHRVVDGPNMLVEILTAVSLVLVLEGILPFLDPEGYKKAVRAMLELPEQQLRIVGLSSMIAGVVFLVIIR